MSRRRVYVGMEARKVLYAGVVHDLTDLAAFVGAPAPTADAIGAAMHRRYGAHLHAKEAFLPRFERWSIRFNRIPRGWVATGRRTWPDPTRHYPGRQLPEFVRIAALLDKNGVLHRSYAPRRVDLPEVIPGSWKNTGPLTRRLPLVIVTVDAPRYGVVVNAPSTPLDPVQIRFPSRTRPIREALQALARNYRDLKRERVREGNERRHADAIARAQAKAAARQGAAVLPVHEPGPV
jgi:hypothetical protein